MSSDSGATADTPLAQASAWRRFLAWVATFEEAMDMSYDEIQDRRILALEREVSTLKTAVDGGGGEVGKSADH